MNNRHQQTMRLRLRVQELAERQKLSDLDLASRSGVDVRVVRRMYGNQQVDQVTLSQLAKVAEALSVTICELIEDR